MRGLLIATASRLGALELAKHSPVAVAGKPGSSARQTIRSSATSAPVSRRPNEPPPPPAIVSACRWPCGAHCAPIFQLPLPAASGHRRRAPLLKAADSAAELAGSSLAPIRRVSPSLKLCTLEASCWPINWARFWLQVGACLAPLSPRLVRRRSSRCVPISAESAPASSAGLAQMSRSRPIATGLWRACLAPLARFTNHARNHLLPSGVGSLFVPFVVGANLQIQF